MVELVDTQDLKSCEPQSSCGFDSRPRYIQKASACRGFFVLLLIRLFATGNRVYFINFFRPYAAAPMASRMAPPSIGTAPLPGGGPPWP